MLQPLRLLCSMQYLVSTELAQHTWLLRCLFPLFHMRDAARASCVCRVWHRTLLLLPAPRRQSPRWPRLWREGEVGRARVAETRRSLQRWEEQGAHLLANGSPASFRWAHTWERAQASGTNSNSRAGVVAGVPSPALDLSLIHI